MSDDFMMDPAYELGGFETAAGHSTVGLRVPQRGKHCRGAENTCKAYRSRGTEYCVGHLRSLGLLEPKPQPEPAESETSS